VPRLAAVCFLWLGTLAGTPAAAQIAAPGPPGPYVIDVHGATSAIPQDASFFPPVPTATIIPSRGYGFDVGAHVYLMRLGPGRLGIGASLLRVGGTASPPAPSPRPTSATTTPATRPDVDATLTIFAPQLSYNFGSAEGWSYVSAGVGHTKVTTGTSAFGGPGSGTSMTPERSVDSRTLSTINIGGGARWFAKAHLAFSFDVRFYLVSARAAEGKAPATTGTTLVAASAGISLR
jgi:hypothetical protein